MRTSPIRPAVCCALFATLIAVSAWIPPIPIGVISVTLQTLAIYLTAGLLPPKWSFSATLLYLALGAVGFPVFSGGQGGLGVLFGSTGGYLMGFLAIPLAVGLITRRAQAKPWMLALSMFIGTLICYSAGSLWYYLQFTSQSGAISFGTVLTLCVLPFLLPDLLKIALAMILVRRLKRFVQI